MENRFSPKEVLQDIESLDQYNSPDFAKFQHVGWAEIPFEEGMEVTFFGQKMRVTDFGIQIAGEKSLDGEEIQGIVVEHREGEYEIQFAVTGKAALRIPRIGQEPIVVPITGSLSEEELERATFRLESNGILHVEINGEERIINPIITPQGAIHSTEGNAKYVVVKGRPVMGK